MAIASAVQRDRLVLVYDERGSPIFTLNAGGSPGDGLKGYTASTVTVQVNGLMITYNDKGSPISTVRA